MKKKIFLLSTSILLIAVLTFGCTQIPIKYLVYEKQLDRSTNQQNLGKLKAEMMMKAVLDSMGTEPIYSSEKDFIIPNPYRTELIHGFNGELYTVLFYYTGLTAVDGAITNDELTPLVFYKNGKLNGWGWQYYNWICTKEDKSPFPK